MTIAEQHRDVGAIRRGYLFGVSKAQEIFDVGIIQECIGAPVTKHGRDECAGKLRRPRGVLRHRKLLSVGEPAGCE